MLDMKDWTNFTLGERLKYAIKRARESFAPKMSQNQLAVAVGIKPQSIQYLCSAEGNREKRSKYTGDLARVLQVTTDWLADGIGQPDDFVFENLGDAYALPPGGGVYPLPSPFKYLRDDIMIKSIQVADGIEDRIGEKFDADKKWHFIQLVYRKYLEYEAENSAPNETAQIVDFMALLQKATN